MLNKMRSPAFPPRRPSALLRYMVAGVIITLCLYWMGGPSPSFPSTSTSSTSFAPNNAPETNYAPADRPVDSPLKTQEDPAPIYHDPEPEEKKKQEPMAEEDSTLAEDVREGKAAGALSPTTTSIIPVAEPTPAKAPAATATGHPIEHLISEAEKHFADVLSQESQSLAEAADAYRKRRGRHPPPGFDKWYAFAAEHKAVMVESFWDQIYHDLGPFWAQPAALIRKEAWDYEMTIHIRDGHATTGSDWFWTRIWREMIETIQHLLPDMDIALNAMDEPRLVVPWEDIDAYMTAAAKTFGLADPKDVVDQFQKLPPPGEGPDKSEVTANKNWENTKPYWEIARRGCAPDSPARKADVMRDFDHAPVISSSLAAPHQYQGFVSNSTLAAEFCHQPDLQGLNGIFVEPLSVSATKALFPMFGGSKLAVNNEILLPAPMYWNEEERFTGGADHGGAWAAKKDEAIWRGVATGGHNHAGNWRAFQRHRFVAMNNASELAAAESWAAPPANFALPPAQYHLRAQADGRLGEWVGGWSNVSFVELMCDKKQEKEHRCNYTAPHFGVTAGIKMKEQFGSKYLPDIDGNSFSGRYLGFLRSTSLPIKATLWHEWHDSRLFAWKHFVPMDNRYEDWYGIMEYFLGYAGGDDDKKNRAPAHDAAAEKIASDGKEWAERVLRKDDMQIYVLRLLLEYARVTDERREKMGWVGDLLKEGGAAVVGDAAAR